MKQNISLTVNNLDDGTYKTLCVLKDDKLFLSNANDLDDLDFFRAKLPKFNTVTFYEQDPVICPDCKCEMVSNGSRKFKPNKLEGFRKEQYVCQECGKSQVTSLEPIISKNCNYSNDIGEKGLNYDTIGYLSYEKKSEVAYLENGIKMSRQTAYYLETIFSREFIERQEKLNLELLKQNGIEPSGYYHYDEQYPHENGEQLVRLALIDAITNMPINDILVHEKDFDKTLIESFLESSLEGLPKEALITDGAPAYPDIVDKIGIKHQLCIFHIIKNHHSKSYRKISSAAKRIQTIHNIISNNTTTINTLKEQNRSTGISEKKKRKNRERIKKLERENRSLRTERKNKRKKLNELLKTNDTIENIYDADDKKSAQRRYNTVNNRRKHLDRDTSSFLVNLGKKFDRTITYYDDQLIPRTNNNVERYFGITLPSYIKRKYRTVEGLTRWLRLQKIRWVRRNVLHDYTIENISMKQYLQEKDCIAS